MTITMDWGTRVINVPKADLTFISGTEYTLDLDVFRLRLKDLEDDADGMTFPDTHAHNTEVTFGGVTYARLIEMINGYTVTFEDGSYSVTLEGANSNVQDVTNLNSVSVRSKNSAGLVVVASSVLTAAQQAQLDRAEIVYKIMVNRAVTEIQGGGDKTITFYDDNDVDVVDTLNVSSDGLTRTNL